VAQVPKALTLVRQRAPKIPGKPATNSPIARVLVDTGVFHLDQEFDFLVPEELSEIATPGVSIRVPFNGRKCDGFIVGRANSSAHVGRMQYIDKVNHETPLLTSTVLNLSRAVARKYAGNIMDILRFAIPVAINSTKEVFPTSSDEKPINKDLIQHYPPSYFDSLQKGEASHVVWTPLPSTEPFELMAEICKIRKGNILILVPDAKSVERCLKVFLSSGIGKNIITWSSELTKSQRYSNFLQILNGNVQIVIGVRGAVFLPLQYLSLIIVWDEGNENYSEIRTPGWHAREVAIERTRQEGCALILGSFSPSLLSTKYTLAGWLKPLHPLRDVFREFSPKFNGISELSSPDQRGRISTKAWKTIQKGLQSGPVLIQVPLRGYIRSLICQKCANHARCPCGGKLIIASAQKNIVCGLCGVFQSDWQCDYCAGKIFRHSNIGDERTLEEIGKAFPGITIRSSNQGSMILEEITQPCIVLATPGSEPRAKHGYAAIVFLDSRIFLERATVNAEEQARLNWFSVSALAAKNAEVFLDVVATDPNFQALLRWDPWHSASRDLLERSDLHLPPQFKAVSVIGPHADIHNMALEFSKNYQVSSLQSTDDVYLSKIILRASDENGQGLVDHLLNYCRIRSAHGMSALKVRVDPIEL
jgi:primosomal protein N' (replication factor Y) (superfamily II helicase)